MLNPQGAQGAAISQKRDNQRSTNSNNIIASQTNSQHPPMNNPNGVTGEIFMRNTGTGSININTSQFQNTGITQHNQLQKNNQRDIHGGLGSIRVA
ncbi:hypothetical protein FGO68_gene11464 [Halteria grandinella]|uniref:Uncharacterized protein n=1 Tax=Halteria grandinella TaxID=5974 RepID=A0A8J8SX98_HALGN|nr:hypothetical protein FGO68_gene11464 [Halteria grandinella]